MARLLVSVDDYVFHHNGLFYFDASTSIGMMDRYLRVFDEVSLIARVDELPELSEGYVLINQREGRISIIRIPFFRGLEVYKKVFRIRKEIKKALINCDAAVVRMPSILGILVISVLKPSKIKFALEVVADPRSTSKRIFSKIVGSSIEFILKKACQSAHGVAYVTKEYLQRLYPPATNGFTANYSSIELEENYFGSVKEYPQTKEFKIIHVSMHIKSASKGQDVLLRALKLAREAGNDVSVDFVGIGNYVAELQKLSQDLGIEDHVHFLGYVAKNDVKNLLLQSDLMVFPSVSEGMPRVVIEACALGLPCLASSVGGIPEILTSDVLFKQNDVEGFSKKLIEIMNDKEYYESLSKRNLDMSRGFSKNSLQIRRDGFYQKLKNICQ